MGKGKEFVVKTVKQKLQENMKQLIVQTTKEKKSHYFSLVDKNNQLVILPDGTQYTLLSGGATINDFNSTVVMNSGTAMAVDNTTFTYGDDPSGYEFAVLQNPDANPDQDYQFFVRKVRNTTVYRLKFEDVPRTVDSSIVDDSEIHCVRSNEAGDTLILLRVQRQITDPQTYTVLSQIVQPFPLPPICTSDTATTNLIDQRIINYMILPNFTLVLDEDAGNYVSSGSAISGSYTMAALSGGLPIPPEPFPYAGSGFVVESFHYSTMSLISDIDFRSVVSGNERSYIVNISFTYTPRAESLVNVPPDGITTFCPSQNVGFGTGRTDIYYGSWKTTISSAGAITTTATTTTDLNTALSFAGINLQIDYSSAAVFRVTFAEFNTKFSVNMGFNYQDCSILRIRITSLTTFGDVPQLTLVYLQNQSTLLLLNKITYTVVDTPYSVDTIQYVCTDQRMYQIAPSTASGLPFDLTSGKFYTCKFDSQNKVILIQGDDFFTTTNFQKEDKTTDQTVYSLSKDSTFVLPFVGFPEASFFPKTACGIRK